jgi:pilus assembly protein CpaE
MPNGNNAPDSVLIVDDSPTAAPELRSLLEREGYHVYTALRAEEALDTIKNSKIDLVVTEALLPTMDGFELVRQIRQTPSRSEIPIIMLTVRSAPEDYASSFEAGANEHFLKPLDAPKMIAAVRGLIARYEMGKLEHRGHPRSSGLPVRAERGHIITVFSPKGGVGTTTIAVNIAVAIKQAAPSARVGLIDLSLEDGNAALLLDIVPTSTIGEWSREDLSGATPHMLTQYFINHRAGISLLAAPQSPEQAETVKPQTVRLTLDLASHTFDYIVVDTASSFGETNLIALELAQTVLLPVTADMASMKSAVNTMRILQALKIRLDKVRPVQNEIIPRAGLTKEQLQTGLGKELFTIPHGAAPVVEAGNQGVPLVTIQPPSLTSKAIVDLARTLCVPETEEVPATRPGVNVFFGRLEEQLGRLRRT